ncbi:mitochondrial ornithine transporter 1 isoform X1 [Drosophila guanche]|uniref:Blast:Mitochondrial ornithine transporter 1 n=1 Tax=Drosophila guanche TaxID=7266 RepID=A0A3B0KKY3_DROGU|nr:mitochondrial ornithine transporter 1 isoform X1 [Drosophila guanche]SPP89240.1 blast:Mitochondrial ornithine transporter 1 [Drosophila guanche]
MTPTPPETMSERTSQNKEEKPTRESWMPGRGSKRTIKKDVNPTQPPPTPLLPPPSEEKSKQMGVPREPKQTTNHEKPPSLPATQPRVGSSRVGSSVLIMAPDELLDAYEQAVLEAEAEEESEQSENERRESQRSGSNRKLSPLSTLEAVRDGLLFIFGKLLRFVRRLDMHGGGTGNNINFVEGLIDFLAGSLGGAAQVYVSQPLDTVKVKLQTFPEAYKGMFDCFVSTYRKDGIFRGLYAGSLPAVVANVAENSVLFAAYGGCQKFVAFMVNKETTGELTTTQNACAGSLAACFSTLTLCPTELIKCKLQALREMKHFIEPSHPQDMRTPWSLTRYIWRTEGLRGFYRGLSSTFMREMPGYFFFFGSYEGTREFLRRNNQTKDEIGPLRTMVAGAIGGVCLWTSTFPADVIKSRIQVKNLNASMYAVGREIVQNEGVLALYRGLLPSVLRTIPATATLFVVYEYTKRALHGTL